MDMLEKMMDMQYEFGSKFTDFGSLNEVQKQEALLEFIPHAIEELIEVRRELPARKHWRDSRFDKVHWIKVEEEMIDTLKFILNMFLILEMDAHDIYEAFCKKSAINTQRLEEYEETKIEETL